MWDFIVLLENNYIQILIRLILKCSMGISISHSSGTDSSRRKSKEKPSNNNNNITDNINNKNSPQTKQKDQKYANSGKQNAEVRREQDNLLSPARQQNSVAGKAQESPSLGKISKKMGRTSLEPISSEVTGQKELTQTVQGSKFKSGSKLEKGNVDKTMAEGLKQGSKRQGEVHTKGKQQREKLERNEKFGSKSPGVANSWRREGEGVRGSMRTMEVSRGVVEKEIDGEVFLGYDWSIPAEEDTSYHRQRQEKISSMNLVLANKFAERMELGAEDQFWRDRRKVMREVLAGRRTNASSDFPSCGPTLETCMQK